MEKEKRMLTIDFTKDKGLIVKNGGQLIDGVKSIKINIDTDTANYPPEIMLTIKPAEVKISSDITYPNFLQSQ